MVALPAVDPLKKFIEPVSLVMSAVPALERLKRFIMPPSFSMLAPPAVDVSLKTTGHPRRRRQICPFLSRSVCVGYRKSEKGKGSYREETARPIQTV
jgi:hypothetical protein